MYKFLERHELSKPTQEEIEILNGPITNEEIEWINKKTIHKENPRTKCLTIESYQMFKD